MSSYSHRGYEHRNGSYGRRRRKTVGFNRSSGGNLSKILILLAVAVVTVALVFVFINYLMPLFNSTENTETPDTADIATSDTPDIPTGYYDSVDDNIYISNGSGYEMFKGLNTTASNYAAVINSIASSVDEEVAIYNMVIPTNTEFGLHEALRADSYSQRDNLDKIASSLVDRVINIDIYNTMNSHKDEYIYYRTDKYMTSLGAFYAFGQFADVSGFEQEDKATLEDLAENKGIIKRFEGEYLQRTKDEKSQPNGNEELFANIDEVDFYKLDLNYTCYSIDKETGKEEEIELFSIDNTVDNPLNVFPAHDTPLLRVINHDSDNDDRLLVLKNVTAEPMLGYLVAGYGQLHVIDTEIYKENVSEYIRKNDITQVLIVSSITDANNSLYCQRLRDLFDSSITG